MKIIKWVVIGLAAILAVPLIVALFTKKDYAAERDIIIAKSNQEVFEYVKYLKNQNEYSPWALRDPNMKKDFRGIDGTVGFVSAWESEIQEVGRGEQEIVKMVEGERIDFELRFFEPFKATEPAYMVTESLSENQTKVKWGFSGRMEYPMNLMLRFINIEEMIGKDLEAGLASLKDLLEKMPADEMMAAEEGELFSGAAEEK